MAKDEKPADDSRARLGTALERLATGRRSQCVLLMLSSTKIANARRSFAATA